MDIIGIDLIGRVNNIRLTHANALFPVFEAVINSIHSIEDNPPGEAAIDVFIEREPQPGLPNTHEGPVTEPIESFVIQDNGVGFTEANYASFRISDTRLKAARGGKGIGRLLWLKAFSSAEITSQYEEDGQHWIRSLTFSLAHAGISAHTKQPSPEPLPRRTVVRLNKYRDGYRDRCPRSADTIAKRLIEHCLEYFVLNEMPEIRLHDPANDSVLRLRDVFAADVSQRSKSDSFTVKNKTLRVTHLCLGSSYDTEHRVHFCANKRTVVSERLTHRIANLAGPLRRPADGKAFVYAGYVSGDYLDETVTNERTRFATQDDSSLDFGDVGWRDIVDGTLNEVGRFLEPFTTPIKEEKHARIKEYVHTKAPQYRSVLTHKPEALDAIPPYLPDEKLDVELYKIDQQYDHELRQRYVELISTTDDTALEEPTDYEQKFEQFLEEWNDAGMSKLARHVAHRKATLSFLQALLSRGDDGKYSLEEAIHKVIFPLRTTSDDIRPDQMNLWIIDERLAYHHYLASDKRLNQMDGVLDSESQSRPDITIFNAASAFVESNAPFGAVTLIEFKRPMRTDYDDDENPIAQIYRYVREIRSGKALDPKGRPIIVTEHTPFYAHIVCDLTTKLREHAENSSFTAMPDNHGYFGFAGRPLYVWVEIVSFSKLLGDAHKRNAILFEKLGLIG